jgi:hypothetical protein
MNENSGANIQFCDAYEELFHQCLEALNRWNQLRDFRQQTGAIGTRARNELRRAQQNYSTTFLQLREHARKCVLCEEMLQAHAGGGERAAAYRVI